MTAVKAVERYAFAFVEDLLDEGLDQSLEALAGDGFTAVAPAVLYHHGRDILPHNPRRVIRFHDGGASHVAVPPPGGRGIRLPATRLAAGRPLARIVERAGRSGLAVFPWIVLTHNSRVGARHRTAAVRNAFGDRVEHALCPANPAIVDLAERVVRAVAREGAGGLVVEAVGYGELDHGYHHERSVAPTSAGLRFLLGVCLCEWCDRHGRLAGVNVAALRRSIIELARRELDGGAAVGPLRWEVIDGVADGQLGRFVEARQAPVAELVSRIVEASRAGGVERVTILDPAGAIFGYATGRPDPDAVAAELGWRTGLDVASLARVGANVGVLGYVADNARLAGELEAYRSRLGRDGRMDVILRPMAPDVRTARDLAAHVETATRAGAVGLGFYHYNLAPRAAWSRVAPAL
jgi:hypothetical protein